MSGSLPFEWDADADGTVEGAREPLLCVYMRRCGPWRVTGANVFQSGGVGNERQAVLAVVRVLSSQNEGLQVGQKGITEGRQCRPRPMGGRQRLKAAVLAQDEKSIGFCCSKVIGSDCERRNRSADNPSCAAPSQYISLFGVHRAVGKQKPSSQRHMNRLTCCC